MENLLLTSGIKNVPIWIESGQNYHGYQILNVRSIVNTVDEVELLDDNKSDKTEDITDEVSTRPLHIDVFSSIRNYNFLAGKIAHTMPANCFTKVSETLPLQIRN